MSRDRSMSQDSLKECKNSSVFLLKSFWASKGRSYMVVWMFLGSPENCSQKPLCNTTPVISEQMDMSVMAMST